jgi:hypothetical protein
MPGQHVLEGDKVSIDSFASFVLLLVEWENESRANVNGMEIKREAKRVRYQQVDIGGKVALCLLRLFNKKMKR